MIRINAYQRGSGGWGCLIAALLLGLAAWYLVPALYGLLNAVAPFLVAAAIIINWQSVASVGRSFLRMIKSNTLWALLLAALTVVVFPLFAFFLFLNAIAMRRMRSLFGGFVASDWGSMRQQKPLADEYADYEEIASASPKSKETHERRREDF